MMMGYCLSDCVSVCRYAISVIVFLYFISFISFLLIYYFVLLIIFLIS